MAKDAANGLTYFLSISAAYKELLGSIRHWANLKIAFEEETIWVKDFSQAQVDSIEVKSIPFKELYYLKENKLYQYGSLLPSRTAPALLWTPIERGLPVSLPSLNHNYFGIQDKVHIRLGASGEEKEPFALLASISLLASYMETVPAIRLQPLQWVLVQENKALIFGTPLLPVQGEAFWKKGSFLFPAGFDLELPVLYDSINQVLNGSGNDWIIWNADNSYFRVNKQTLRPLSISSFRLTIKADHGH